MQFEYKVVPAPIRGKKARGLKTPADRFANAMSEVMNDLAAEGWEYQRAETLPSEERSGLTGRSRVEHNLLIFRRKIEDGAEEVTAKTNATLETTDAEGHAPKLPSADAAQTLPENEPRILFAEERDEEVAD